MTHPSIQGLREAVAAALNYCTGYCSEATGPDRFCPLHGDPEASARTALDTIATYLTEHGVGWFGEGLVRFADSIAGSGLLEARTGVLVPVPQDGEQHG